jgi:hypothetical protein
MILYESSSLTAIRFDFLDVTIRIYTISRRKQETGEGY